MKKKHFAHYGRPFTAQHRKRISEGLRRRSAAVREALALAERARQNGGIAVIDEKRGV